MEVLAEFALGVVLFALTYRVITGRFPWQHM
jgi:hypothetical protein